MSSTFTIKVRQKTYTALTLEEISKQYAELRDESGEGGTTWRPVNITDDSGNVVGFLSYNAKVWSGSIDNSAGATCLFNPYAEA